MQYLGPARVGAIVLLVSALIGGQTAAQVAVELGELIREVQIGHAGRIKIGHWTPVRIRIDETRLPPGAELELATTDSDAVPVNYRSRPQADSGGWIRGHVWIGRFDAGLTIRLVDSQRQVIASKSWGRLSDSFVVVPATDQVVLRLGAPLNLPPSGTPSRTEQRRLISVDDESQLPTRWFEYDGVDLVIMTTGTTDNIALRMNAEQIDALWKWISLGGRLVLSVGENAEQLVAGGKSLERFGPGPFRRLEALTQADSLEFYAGSAVGQLITDSATQSLKVATFDSVEGTVEVRQGNTSLIHRRSVGLGEIVFVSFDLEQPLIDQWKGNPRLLSRLLGHAGEETGLVKAIANASAVNHGYRDLSGQVRSAGERFRGVSVVTFMLVAALIVLYTICIGPLDYFLLNRVLGRMEWTWVTSTVMMLVFAGAAWTLVQKSKPDKVLVNHTEIVDVDASGNAVRGGVWANIYSPRTQTFDLRLPGNNELGVDLRTRLISAQGLPGDGIGGMDSRTVTRLFRSPYAIELIANADSTTGSVARAPIAVASTKPLFAKWEGQHSWQDLGEVTFQEQGRQLGGSFRNPFGRELRNCVLLYGNTAYRFGECPVGGSLDLNSGSERSLKVYLQAADANAEVARWATADRRIPRVFEMFMFFRAAGGEDFTGLSNSYQNEFDLSEQLALGRAIFVCRIDDFAASPLAMADRKTPPDFDLKTTFVRFVFPVRFVRPSKR